MQRNAEFLEYTPSQQAATALILALNLSHSHVCDSIGLRRVGCDITTDVTSCADSDVNEFDLKFEETNDPLSVWTNKIKTITQLSAKDHLNHVYAKLISHVDNNHFKGKLSADNKLWINTTATVRGFQSKILEVTKELVN